MIKEERVCLHCKTVAVPAPRTISEKEKNSIARSSCGRISLIASVKSAWKGGRRGTEEGGFMKCKCQCE